VLKATLKGPRLAPGTRLKNDLEDHGVTGVSRQQPHPIFRPERASPQGYQRLKRSLANLAKRNLPELTTLVRTRLRRMQYRPDLLAGFLASTRLDRTPFSNPDP
jgi:hypothetical protein